MADVACFCGCVYSFEGGAGACPKCGEWATVTGGPVVSGYGQQNQHEAENEPPLSFLDLDTGLVEWELDRIQATRRSGPSAENMLRDLGITSSRS